MIIGPVSGSTALMIGIGLVALIYLADWAIDKLWWKYVDKVLEGVEKR